MSKYTTAVLLPGHYVTWSIPWKGDRNFPRGTRFLPSPAAMTHSLCFCRLPYSMKNTKFHCCSLLSVRFWQFDISSEDTTFLIEKKPPTYFSRHEFGLHAAPASESDLLYYPTQGKIHLGQCFRHKDTIKFTVKTIANRLKPRHNDTKTHLIIWRQNT